MLTKESSLPAPSSPKKMTVAWYTEDRTHSSMLKVVRTCLLRYCTKSSGYWRVERGREKRRNESNGRERMRGRGQNGGGEERKDEKKRGKKEGGTGKEEAKNLSDGARREGRRRKRKRVQRKRARKRGTELSWRWWG